MNRTLAVVMDPIGSIKPYKDTTLALMLAAQKRGWALRYLEMQDLWIRDGVAMCRARPVSVFDDRKHWFELGDAAEQRLDTFDAILMRKDPPFDLEFVAATYILERAELDGALVFNRARSLRDANEKVFISWFPQCCAPTVIARDSATLRAFHAEHGDVICKPLDGMGGTGIFRVGRDGLITERRVPDLQLGDEAASPCHLGDQDAPQVADRRRGDVLVGAFVALHGADVHAAFMRKSRIAHIGLSIVGHDVGNFGNRT